MPLNKDEDTPTETMYVTVEHDKNKRIIEYQFIEFSKADRSTVVVSTDARYRVWVSYVYGNKQDGST